MATVLIVDADAGMTEVLVRLLAQEGHYALAAQQGDEALRLLHKVQVDLIMVEYPLPPATGGDFRRWLRADPLLASIPLLLLLPAVMPEMPPQDVLTERDASLTKPLHLPELKQTIWRLLGQAPRPASVQSSQTIVVGPITIVPQGFQATINGQNLSLSSTEFRLLRFLAERAGEVCSNDGILEAVWHYPPNTGSPELVRVHIRNLRRKIGQHYPHPEHLLRSLRGLGYLLSPDN